MYALDFEYAGEKLSDYGMVLCSFDGGSGVETVSSGADITFEQAKPCGSWRFSIYSRNYNSAYTSTFQICKNPCIAHMREDMALEPEFISLLQRWLCRTEYHKFKVYQAGYERMYWNAVFSSTQVEVGGQVMGLELTMYADAPFGYVDELSYDFECGASESFELYNESDEPGYIIPDMEITVKAAGDFSLANSLDKKLFYVGGCSAGEVLAIDGKCQILTSSVSAHDVIDDFNFYFPRIFNTYQERVNKFTPNLACSVNVSYSPIMRAGI